MKRLCYISIITVLTIIIMINFASSQNYYTYNTVNINENKYSFSLGVWNAKLTGDTFAPSTTFTTDLQNDLGFGNNKGMVTFDFNYRISGLNGVGLSFFSGTHKAVRTLTRNITLPGDPNDVNVANGTTVFSSIKYNAFDLYYKRYFTTDSNYEFYGLASIRFNNIEVDFSTSTNAIVSGDFNLPNLQLGLGGNFKLSENLKAFYQAQGLSLSLGGKKINFIEYLLGIQFKFSQNWGINLGYRYNNLKAEDDFSRSLKLRYQGLTFGLSGKF